MRSVVQIYLGPPVRKIERKDVSVSFGAVAQLGERRPCKAEVVGSNPISSTRSLVCTMSIEVDIVDPSDPRGSLKTESSQGDTIR